MKILLFLSTVKYISVWYRNMGLKEIPNKTTRRLLHKNVRLVRRTSQSFDKGTAEKNEMSGYYIHHIEEIASKLVLWKPSKGRTRKRKKVIHLH